MANRYNRKIPNQTQDTRIEFRTTQHKKKSYQKRAKSLKKKLSTYIIDLLEADLAKSA